MKMTKEIKIINAFDEEVIISPIPYDAKIKILELTTDMNILMDQIVEEIRKNNENMELIDTYRQKYNALSDHRDSLNEKYNYWHCGLENIDNKDKERFKHLYVK